MKINVPTSWEGVTLRQFQAVTSQLNEAKEKLEKLEGREKEKFNYEVECVLISTLTGQDIDEIMSLSRGSHNHIMNQLGFLSEPISGKVKNKVKVNGKRYYFEQNARKINGGQWVTLMHFLEDEDKIEQNLHNLLACFAYRVKWFRKEYNGKHHEEVANDMLDLPITFVKPLTDFFLSDWLNYVGRMTRYSEYLLRGAKRLMELRLKRSSQNTDGSTPSTT